jgi:hypothetical protein
MVVDPSESQVGVGEAAELTDGVVRCAGARGNRIDEGAQ